MSEHTASETEREASLFGVLARFAGPSELLDAAESLRDSGYRRFDTHSPFPIHGMDQALGLGRSKVPILVLAGGLLGACFAQTLQWYLNTRVYPLDIDGMPLNTPEAFVPITFETTILFASFAAVFGMLVLNGLPRLYHPLFRSAAFTRASDDGFFVSVEARDPKFDERETPALLAALGGTEIELVDD
jgi:hypothetical protein